MKKVLFLLFGLAILFSCQKEEAPVLDQQQEGSFEKALTVEDVEKLIDSVEVSFGPYYEITDTTCLDSIDQTLIDLEANIQMYEQLLGPEQRTEYFRALAKLPISSLLAVINYETAKIHFEVALAQQELLAKLEEDCEDCF